MARITRKVKLFIVKVLAEFETPTSAAQQVKEVFNVEVSPQQCERYDPTKRMGFDLSQELRDKFFEYRRLANDELEAIPIANKRYRLQLLQGLVDEFPNNPVFTPKWIEQAAKEMAAQQPQTAVNPVTGGAENQTKASVELEIKKLELQKLQREVNPPETRPPEEDYKISLNPDEEIPNEPIL